MTGEELRRWRTERNLTIYQLAEVLDVSGATISRWENNKRKVPAFMWRALEHVDCTTRSPPPSEDA